jgi:hypothetical protein
MNWLVCLQRVNKLDELNKRVCFRDENSRIKLQKLEQYGVKFEGV